VAYARQHFKIGPARASAPGGSSKS
jgi:hypothetical protein